MTPWGQEVARLIEEYRLGGIRDAAKRLGLDHSNLSKQINGKADKDGRFRKPTVKQSYKIAGKLGLNATETKRLVLLANLAKAPIPIQEEVERQAREIARLKRAIAEMRGEILRDADAL